MGGGVRVLRAEQGKAGKRDGGRDGDGDLRRRGEGELKVCENGVGAGDGGEDSGDVRFLGVQGGGGLRDGAVFRMADYDVLGCC